MGKPKSQNPSWVRPGVIVIDGPLVPLGHDQHIRRHVEFIFSRAPFHNRCKPGLSHSGVGFQFRRASNDAYAQFSPILAPSEYAGEDEPIQQMLNSWAFASGLPITSRGSRESIRGFLLRGTNARRKYQEQQPF